MQNHTVENLVAERCRLERTIYEQDALLGRRVEQSAKLELRVQEAELKADELQSIVRDCMDLWRDPDRRLAWYRRVHPHLAQGDCEVTCAPDNACIGECEVTE